MIKKIRTKKAQMKIQQMTFMLVAVTLFFVLVGLLVIVLKFNDLKKSAAALEEQSAMLLVARLANSPEFSCGTSTFGTSKTNCVDFDKIMILSRNINKYSEFWGARVRSIEITKIVKSDDKNEVICTNSNYPECDKVSIVVNEGNLEGIPAENFVILCKKANLEGIVYDDCDVARMSVKYSMDAE